MLKLTSNHSLPNVREGEAVSEANYINIPYNIFNRYYHNLRNYLFNPVITRSYEHPYKWYYIVWKPFNRSYDKDAQWYQTKGLDKCRRQISNKANAYLITREIVAKKTHIHGLICSSQDLDLLHQKNCYSKYKMHVSSVLSQADRHRVTDYLLKESKNRSFKKYVDYVTFSR